MRDESEFARLGVGKCFTQKIQQRQRPLERREPGAPGGPRARLKLNCGGIASLSQYATILELTPNEKLQSGSIDTSAFVSRSGECRGEAFGVFPLMLYNSHMFLHLESVHYTSAGR